MRELAIHETEKLRERADPQIDAVLADLLDRWRETKRDIGADIASRAAAPMAQKPVEAHQEAEPDEADDDRLADLQARLAITEAALKSERQHLGELRVELEALEQLKASLQDERDRAEDLRADRDRWAERAEALAYALFQEARAARAGHRPE